MPITKKDLKKLGKLTKLRQEEEVRREIQEEAEKLEATGQESEKKAKKWVDEDAKEQKARDLKEEERVLTQLQKKRHLPKIFSYKEKLAIELANAMRDMNPPKSHGWEVEIVEKGILLKIFTRDGIWVRSRKFAICGDPFFDWRMCQQFVDWAGQEMGNYTRNLQGEKVLPSGIVLPE